MLQELCGEESLPNLVIVTTYWGQVTQEVAEGRERQLITDETLFKPLLEKGARMCRHTGTAQSAHEILSLVLEHGKPLPLKIQRELVDEQKDIMETGAGIALDKELALMTQQHKEEMARIREEMAEALEQKDLESRRELEEFERELEAKVQKIVSDRQMLSVEYSKKRSMAQTERQGSAYAETATDHEIERGTPPSKPRKGRRSPIRRVWKILTSCVRIDHHA